MSTVLDLNSLELLDQEDLITLVKSMVSGEIFLNFHGKRSVMEISKRVRLRVNRCMLDLRSGSSEELCDNMGWAKVGETVPRGALLPAGK